MIILSAPDLEKKLAELRTLLKPSDVSQILESVGQAVANAAEASVPEYPPPSGKPLPYAYTINGRPSKFPSVRARIAFFKRLKAGLIKIPYVRTGVLGNSITSEVEEDNDSAIVTIGTSIKYAPDVIGQNQIPYHVGTWWQLENEMRKSQPVLIRAARQRLGQEVAKRVK